MNPSDETDSINRPPPSRLDAITISLRNRGGFKHSGENTTRSLPRRGRRNSDFTGRRSTTPEHEVDDLPRPFLGRSRSLDFPPEILRARQQGQNGTKSLLDFSPEDAMRSINRRRLDRKLHLADSCTKPGNVMVDNSFKTPPNSSRRFPKHSRSKSGGLEELNKSQGLFSVSESPDAEENGDEQDTPNVIVFRRRRPSMRATNSSSNTWLE